MSSNDLPEITQQNRRAWNEIAQVRSRTFPPAEFFAEGGSTLDHRAVEAAQAAFGTLSGLRVIYLQSATGEDTLSWAVLGAQATGIDISDEQIALARAKAEKAKLPVRFIAADIYELPAALPEDLQSGYDLVFTGGGAIVWLPDLQRWAAVVASLLKPGGRLLLIDEHPLANCLWVEQSELRITGNYFSRNQPEVGSGWTHFTGGEAAKETKFEFNWPLGDIITALAQAGLIIERLEEFPGGAPWRFRDKQAEALNLPGDYLLLARRA